MCVICFNHMDYRRNIADFCFVLSIRQDIDLTAVQLFGMKVVFLLSYCSIKNIMTDTSLKLNVFTE